MRRLPLYGVQGKFTFRLLAMTLFGQAVILSFFALVARGTAIAGGRGGDGSTLLWLGCGLALLSLVAAGLMRRPYGITLGWLVQVLTWAGALVETAMIAVSLIFTGLWVLLLVQGLKADALVAERERAASSQPAGEQTGEQSGGAEAGGGRAVGG